MKSARRLFFVLLGVNLLLIVATLAAFTLASGVAQKKSQKIAELKAQVETNDQAIGSYIQLEHSLNSNKDLEAVLEKALPPDKAQSEAIAELDKFSREASVPIRQISFIEGTNKTAGQTLTSPSGLANVLVVSVSLNSDKTKYENVLNFLKKIENNQRRMQVKSLTITPNSTSPDQLDRVDLVIDIYQRSGS